VPRSCPESGRPGNDWYVIGQAALIGVRDVSREKTKNRRYLSVVTELAIRAKRAGGSNRPISSGANAYGESLLDRHAILTRFGV